MSAKYRRVKQKDLALPAPLRWLTRAFSSITMAVILLSLVALYGMLETIPLILMTLGGLYAGAILISVGVAVLVSLWLARKRIAWPFKIAGAGAVFAGAGLASWQLCVAAYWWTYTHPWLTENRAMTVNRLPALEMTSQQFYGWWPMQLLLILFVINMIWATIRRIEFKFVNIGVITVHAGIVVIAVGSIFYGRFKVEGDMILFRQDLGGGFENVFYDASEPALYIQMPGRELMFALTELPRFNDYPLGELDIPLHERPDFTQHLGENVRMTIPGYVAYGELTEQWRAPENPDQIAAATRASPVLQIALSSDNEPPTGNARPSERSTDGWSEGTQAQTYESREDAYGESPSDIERVTLAADVPAERVVEEPNWAIEYLVNPSSQRLADLNSEVIGDHGLVVEIPGHQYRQVHPISAGRTIELGDTGYTLTVEEIGPYDLPFVSEGYEDARDTRAVVRIQGNGKDFTRIVLHRYPELSQDFGAQSDDDDAGPSLMGERREPDPAIHLAYLDNTRTQYHLFAQEPAGPVQLIARFPGGHRLWLDAPPVGLPLTSPHAPEPLFFHVERQIPQAVKVIEPRPTPRAQRRADDEGHHLQALLPVLIEVDLPEAEYGTRDGGTWRRLVWMRNMRYPRYPDTQRRPVTVDIPTVGRIDLAFSRKRYRLPFAMALREFKMTPYQGSDIPRDFESELLIADVDEQGRMRQQPRTHHTHLNNPVIYRSSTGPLHLRRVKISQNAWDPPTEGDPEANARDDQGRFMNQQRFTVVGIGNNVGIHIIAIGGTMMILGIPWAFYIKPMLVQRERRRLQRQWQQQQQQQKQQQQREQQNPQPDCSETKPEQEPTQPVTA